MTNDQLLDAIGSTTELVRSRITTLSDREIEGPSRLPDWSIGHLLSHIAFNADAVAQAGSALRAGEPAYMYPGGVDQRSDDIERGARRSAAEIRDHLDRSATAFEEEWRLAPPAGGIARVPGDEEFPSVNAPFMRLREVSVHGVDLGACGIAPTEWTATYVAADLAGQWDTVQYRTTDPVGVADETGHRWSTGEPDRWLSADRRALLAWLLDRAELPGAPTLVGWGDRVNWRPSLH